MARGEEEWAGTRPKDRWSNVFLNRLRFSRDPTRVGLVGGCRISFSRRVRDSSDLDLVNSYRLACDPPTESSRRRGDGIRMARVFADSIAWRCGRYHAYGQPFVCCARRDSGWGRCKEARRFVTRCKIAQT